MSNQMARDTAPCQTEQNQMAEELPLVLWAAKPDGTVDWVNREFERYTGLSGANVAKGGWLEALHPDDREPTLKVWGNSIATGDPYRAEFRMWSAARGGWRAHLVEARPRPAPDGGVARWYGMAMDIEDLRGAERAQQAELRLQGIEHETLQRIGAGEPLERILQHLCNAMADVLDGAHVCVGLVGEDGATLDRWIFADALGDWCRGLDAVPIAEGAGACGTALARRAPVIVGDMARDGIWQDYRHLAMRHGLASCWSVPLFDAERAPLGVLACYHETPRTPTETEMILVRRAAETIRNTLSQVDGRDRLLASEARYRTLFDFLPIAIWEEDVSDVLAVVDEIKARGVTDFPAWIDENPDFLDRAIRAVRIIDLNRAARELHGHSGPVGPTLDLALPTEAPQLRTSIRGMLIAHFEGRSTYTITHSLPLRNGNRRDLLVQMRLPEAGDGRMLVTELDITEQRRVEDRFRHVAQASSDIIFDRDLSTDQTWVNDVATWHDDYPPGTVEVPRTVWVEGLHPEDRDAVLARIDAAIAGDADHWEGEYRLRRPNGEYVPVRERASILRDEGGRAVRVIGNIVDLSEQKALEAQLRQSQRLDAIGQMTGGIAHDFNNLLTVILGNADMLRDALAGDDATGAMAGQIVDAAERAAELTQRLLAFARKQPLSPGEFDPNAVIEGMRMLVERSLTPAITLDFGLGADVERVHIDRALFESALLNLAVNARDAMPDGGTLRILTETVTVDSSGGTDALATGDYVRITVSDTGKGMDEETQLRAFEPFFTTKATGQGSGLGLSMVYGFVKQSGGHIRINSAAGEGTCVEILLPHVQSSGEAGDRAEIPPRTEVSAAAAHVLLVEDDDHVRDYIQTILRGHGFQVEAVPRAAGGLERIRSDAALDLLLSDVVMPGGMGGRQLAETALRERPDLPVLLMSGHSDEIFALDDPLDPRIAFLEKPFRKRDLIGRITTLLDGRGRR